MMNTLSGKWVFDSHLFIYAIDEASPLHPTTKKLFSVILKQAITPIATQQNIIEAENVLIRVYKKDPVTSADDLEEILSIFDFTIITPLALTYKTFHKLQKKYPTQKPVFDYYLAATMLDNGINQILTVNTKDFAAISEIKAVNPFA